MTLMLRVQVGGGRVVEVHADGPLTERQQGYLRRNLELLFNSFEEPGPAHFCEGCQTELVTERLGSDWVLPQHGHPQRERICPGSGTPGVAP
jgi:hypothetical protein